MIKISDLKVFGTSPEQIISAVAGQPLLEIRLHQIVLNMIGSVFVSENLAYLGQACGELLRRLCGDTKMRHAILEKAQQFPLIASPPLLLMSMGQFDHPFWFNARQMVSKIGAMSVSKQAHVRMWVDPTGDDWESPGLPTDISGTSVGFKRYRSSR